MRNLNICLFLIFLVSHICLGQVGNNSNSDVYEWVGVADSGMPLLEVTKKRGRNYYRLSYYNEEYPNTKPISRIEFYANRKEIESLYNFMLQGFEYKKMEHIDLGKGTMFVNAFVDSKKNIFIYVGVNSPGEINSYFLISKKQLGCLFGKDV